MSTYNVPSPGNVLIRLPDVLARTGMSKSTVYNKLNSRSAYYDVSFPRSIRISPGMVGWVQAELDSWIDSRIQVSRS